MVARFGSGGAGISQVSENRVFRGAPTRKSVDTSSTVVVQQNQLNQELSLVDQDIARQEQLQRDNNPSGGGIVSRSVARQTQVALSSLRAKKAFLEQQKSVLAQGRVFSNFSDVTSQAGEVARLRAQQEQSKISRGIRNRQERMALAERQAEGRLASKPMFEQQAEGSFTITQKGVTRAFTAEGQEIALQSTSEGIRGTINNNTTATSSIQGEVASAFRLKSEAPKPTSFKQDFVSGKVSRGVGVGIGKVAVSSVEFGGRIVQNLGTATIKPGESFSDRKKFELTFPAAKEIKLASTNRYVVAGQVLTIAPALFSAGVRTASSLKLVGVKQTVLRGAQAISPLSIRSGSFGGLEGVNLKELKFDAVAVSKTNGGVTDRLVIGRDTNNLGVELISRQKFRSVSPSGTIGAAKTTVVSQGLRYDAGTFTPFTRSFSVDSAIVGKIGIPTIGTNNLRVNIQGLDKGFTGTISSVTRAESFVTPSNANFVFRVGPQKMFTTKIGGLEYPSSSPLVKGFVSGPGKQITRISRSSISSPVRVSNLNLRGVELVLPDSSSGFGFVVPRSSGPVSPVTKTTSVSTPVLSTVTKQSITPSVGVGVPSRGVVPIVPQTKLSVKQRSVVSSSTFTRTNQVSRSVSTPRTVTVPLIKQNTVVRQVSVSDTSPRVSSKQITTPISTTVLRSTPITSTVPRQTSPSSISAIPETPILRTKTTPITPFVDLKVSPSTSSSSGLFPVFVRRQRKFRQVGVGRSVEQAFSIGQNITAKTLAASFIVKGLGKNQYLKTPKGYYSRSNKQGRVFVELPKYRLSTTTEKLEIQTARRKKRKKKR